MAERLHTPRTPSLYRHTLVRIMVAFFVLEILVGALGFWLLMLPVLRSHAQNVAKNVYAAQLKDGALPRGFTRSDAPATDGGLSILPFNLVFAQALQQTFGHPVTIRATKGVPGQYWFAVGQGASRFWQFDQTVVVGAWPVGVLIAWVLAATASGAIVSLWLTASLSRPIEQLRRRLRNRLEAANVVTGVGIAELDVLEHEYLALRARIAQSLEDRTTLLLGLAHDLSAPVSRLTMAVELHGRNLKTIHQEMMAANLAEMRSTIAQFLGAAGCLGAGTRQSYSSAELLDWLRQRYDDTPSVQVVPVADAGTLSHISNRHAMERIMVNLIDNALRHGGGSATIALHDQPETLCISVSDQGSGFPGEDKDSERFFRPFERCGNTEGTGLGLALSRLMAEQNGWTLRAHQRSPHGLMMQVCLPKE